MSFKRGTHWKGPLTGDHRAARGLFEDQPLGILDQVRSPYKQYLEQFKGLADITDLEDVGWTETAVGTAASRSWAYNEALGLLVVNADTVADEGTNAQLNVAATADTVSHAHNLLGPVVSTATLMDTRELIWATRIAFLVGNGTTFDSKLLMGWFVTDTALMTPGTGALAITTGGGIGFHINGDTGTRTIDAVVQGTTSATSASTGVSVGTLTTTFTNYVDLGFRARWIDASAGTGVVDFYVNGVRTNRVVGSTTALPMQSTQTYSNSIELINGPATADQVDIGIEHIYNAISRPGLTYPYTSGLNL